MAGVPEAYRWVFWNVDTDALDLERDAHHILGRVLEHGGLREVQWLVSVYGLDQIHAFFRDVGHPELSDRTVLFWRAVFHAEEEPWARPPAWRKSSSAPWID